MNLKCNHGNYWSSILLIYRHNLGLAIHPDIVCVILGSGKYFHFLNLCLRKITSKALPRGTKFSFKWEALHKLPVEVSDLEEIYGSPEYYAVKQMCNK